MDPIRCHVPGTRQVIFLLSTLRLYKTHLLLINFQFLGIRLLSLEYSVELSFTLVKTSQFIDGFIIKLLRLTRFSSKIEIIQTVINRHEFMPLKKLYSNQMIKFWISIFDRQNVSQISLFWRRKVGMNATLICHNPFKWPQLRNIVRFTCY